MALSDIGGASILQYSQLDWAELDLVVSGTGLDPIIALQVMAEGFPASGVRLIRSDQDKLRLPRKLVGSVVSLLGSKSDESKAYIALGVDLNNDVSVTITEVDESGGGSGPGGGSARIAGTVSVDGSPAARKVLVIADDPAGRKIVGEGQSAPDGAFDITYQGWTGPVVALALDEYGDSFEASTAINQGALVHPTTPNGYVYEVTTAGTTGAAEPTWSTSGSVQSGSVTFTPRPYFRPVASGPLTGEPVTPTPIMATESGGYMVTEAGELMIVE